MTTKPRMLFVDDRSRRIHAALKRYSDKYDVTIAPNVLEALRLLSSEIWDIVSLDFDLNGQDFCDPESKDCAMEIVRVFNQCGWPPDRNFPNFIIHTSNIFGGELLYKELWNFIHSDKFPKTKTDKAMIRITKEIL